MKKNLFVTIATLFLGFSSAHACPDLTGVYICKEDGKDIEKIEIKRESLEGGLYSYNFKWTDLEDGEVLDLDLTADGKPVLWEIEDDGFIIKGAFVLSCFYGNKNLNLTSVFDIYNKNKLDERHTTSLNMSLDKNKNLFHSGYNQINNGPKEKFSYICKRL